MSSKDKTKAVAEIEKRLKHARKLVRKYVRPGRSLSEELIRERRLAARKEQRELENG